MGKVKYKSVNWGGVKIVYDEMLQTDRNLNVYLSINEVAPCYSVHIRKHFCPPSPRHTFEYKHNSDDGNIFTTLINYYPGNIFSKKQCTACIL